MLQGCVTAEKLITWKVAGNGISVAQPHRDNISASLCANNIIYSSSMWLQCLDNDSCFSDQSPNAWLLLFLMLLICRWLRLVSVCGSVLQNMGNLYSIPADLSKICLGKHRSCFLLCRMIFRNYCIVGVSVLGDIWSLSGHSSGQPVPVQAVPALSRAQDMHWMESHRKAKGRR